MATLTWQRNTNTVGSPTWTAFEAGNRIVFSGSATDLTATIPITAWNDGTHEGSADPGTDRCNQGGGANPGGPGGGGAHNNNVKFLSTTTMSVNGAASENINDTNLAQGECTLRVLLTNGTAISTQNSRLYCYDGTTDATQATAIESYAFERGVSATAWTLINDDSAGTGGDNSGERLELGEKTSTTSSPWYLAISARGESAGAKTAFDYKLYTEVF